MNLLSLFFTMKAAGLVAVKVLIKMVKFFLINEFIPNSSEQNDD